MAQWFERSPPTNVVRARFRPMPYVGCVCCYNGCRGEIFASPYTCLPLGLTGCFMKDQKHVVLLVRLDAIHDQLGKMFPHV